MKKSSRLRQLPTLRWLMAGFRVTAVVLLGFPSLALAADRLLTIRTATGTNAGFGFVVDIKGHVLAVIDGRNAEYAAILGDRHIVLDRVASDEATGVSLLKVRPDGLPLIEPIPIAREPLVPGVAVKGYRGSGSSGDGVREVAGRIVTWHEVGPPRGLIVFELPGGAVNPGSPLLNECRQLMGVVFWKDRLLESVLPEASERNSRGMALALEELIRVFGAHGMQATVSASPCTTADDRLKAHEMELQELRRRADTAAVERSAEQAQYERIKREHEQASQADQKQMAKTLKKVTDAMIVANDKADEAMARADELQRQYQQARESASREKAALTAATREREQLALASQEQAKSRQIFLQWTLGITAILLVVACYLWFRRHQMHRQAEHERVGAEEKARLASLALAAGQAAEEERRAVPDVLILGELEGGWRLDLRIPNEALMQKGGVLVGRNPPAPGLVINHEEVSRRHFSLRWTGRRVEIKDLGSTNGTWVNGQELKGGDIVDLANGDRLELGELTLMVQLVPHVT